MAWGSSWQEDGAEEDGGVQVHVIGVGSSRGVAPWARAVRSGAARGSGDGVPRPQGTSRLETPEGLFVYAPWPCDIHAYPKPGDPFSWGELQDVAAAAGCTLKLKGRATQTRRYRSAAVTIKGEAAKDILRYVVQMTKGVVRGLDWSRCPLAQQVNDEDTSAVAGDKEAREKVMWAGAKPRRKGGAGSRGGGGRREGGLGRRR